MPDLHRDFALQLCIMSLWPKTCGQIPWHRRGVQRQQLLPNHWKSWPRGHWFIDESNWHVFKTFALWFITFVLPLRSEFWSSWQFWHGLPTLIGAESQFWAQGRATPEMKHGTGISQHAQLKCYSGVLIPPFSVVLSRLIFQRTLQWALSLGEQHLWMLLHIYRFCIRLGFLHSRLHRDLGRSNAAERVKICLLVFWVVQQYIICSCGLYVWCCDIVQIVSCSCTFDLGRLDWNRADQTAPLHSNSII